MRMYQKLSASRLKEYAKLTRKKYRKQEQLFLIEGVRSVIQALKQKNLDIKAVIADDKSGFTPAMFDENDAVQFPDFFVTDQKSMLRLSKTENSQGIAAVARVPREVDPLLLNTDSHPFLLALDGIADPGNLGTIYRTAAWFGVDAILLDNSTTDLFNAKVVRSTAGATGSVPYFYCDLPETLDSFSNRGWEIYTLDLDPDAVRVQDASFKSPVILVTGNEAHGIRPAIKSGWPSIYIPGETGRVESLNASVATGIMLSEISRQKIPAGG